MDNNADPLIDQGGEQAYNDALQYVEGAYGQDYKSPHIADGRVNGRACPMMVSRGMKWE